MSGLNPSSSPKPDRREEPSDRRFRRIGKPISAVSFWSAIALPAIYLPLLLGGIDDAEMLLSFLLLFALHIVMLVGGHRYRS